MPLGIVGLHRRLLVYVTGAGLKGLTQYKCIFVPSIFSNFMECLRKIELMGLNATEAMGGHGDSVAPSEQLDPNLSSKTRIFIGGLGVSVTSNDLETTFSPLGRVLGVEIVRTGGRSFAYMDFEPFSDKHLNKLFSSYNGCMWKGGRLKLEKAKEHYLVRLQREWAMDTSPSSVGDVACLTTMTTEADINKASKSSGKGMPMISEASGLRIFFPQSKKVKVLPSKGTGKHKYSFERVESLPLSLLHVCGCMEHDGHPETDESNQVALDGGKATLETGGITENERDLMKSVMEKLFMKEDQTQATTDHSNGIPQGTHVCRYEKRDPSNARAGWQEPKNPVDTGQINDSGAAVLSLDELAMTKRIQESLVEEKGLNNIEAIDHELDPVVKDTRNERCSSRKNAEMAVAQDTLKSKGENAKGWEATLEEIKFEKKMTIHCKNVNAIPTNIDAKGEPDTINLVDRKRLRADDAAFSSIQDKDEGGNSNMETGSEIKSSVDYKMHDGGGVLHVQDSGTSWVQKASWKDLVGETGQASFSLSSICGGVTPGCFGDSKDSKTHAAVDSKHSVDKVKRKGLVMNDKNQEHVKGLQGSSDEGSHLFLKSQVVQNTCSDHQEKKSEPSAEMQIIGDRIEGQGSKENSEEMQRQAKESNIQLHRNLSSYRQDTSSAGVCTFMRSVDAEDEWLKSKAAVRSHAKAYRKIVKSSKILGTAPMGRF